MNEARKTMDPKRPDEASRAEGEGERSGDAAPGETPTTAPRGGVDASQGSRGGSPLGSQTDRTGMGDGQPAESSQGLAGAQGSGGGADRGPPGSIGGGPSPD